MNARFTIVGIGEALFDVFPQGHVLGGAPLNVAFHAHQLGQAIGGKGLIASRVGQDALGEELLAAVRGKGMATDFIQSDPDKETGKVYVSIDFDGQPTYEIVKDVAWDWIQFDPDLEGLAARCEAVCFGSLAQRASQSRSSIQRFLSVATRAVRMFDVNLRAGFDDTRNLVRSLELCDVFKVNTTELARVAELLHLSSPAGGAGAGQGAAEAADAQVDVWAREVLGKFKLKLVAVTRGPRGTLLLTPRNRVEGGPASYPAAPGADSVGAGDACAAAILVGLTQRWPLDKVVRLANHAGAFVASQPGATPALPAEVLALAQG